MVLFFGSRGQTSIELSNALFGSKKERISNFSPDRFKSSLEKISSQNGSKVINSIFVDDTFTIKDDFRSVSEEMFKTHVEPVDFSGGTFRAVARINQKINEDSNGSFPKMIDFLSPGTKMILINVLTFKNDWKYPFDRRKTKVRPFLTEDGQNIPVEMMSLTANLEMGASELLNIMAVKLPYRGGKSSLILILPRPGLKLKDIMKRLTLPQLKFFLSSHEMQRTKTKVLLPKFSLESSLPLVDDLRRVGIRKIFDASRSNFTGISDDSSGLFVGEFFQKTKIDLDEFGSRASSATAAIFKQRSLSFHEDFLANRPFLFMIASFDRRALNEVLFMGQYTSPPLPYVSAFGEPAPPPAA